MTPLQPIKELHVGINFGLGTSQVGRLAIKDHKIYFEYEPDFLKSGLEISPFRLPGRPGVTSFEQALFDGLPGVFHDCLPDGWGRLLFDRSIRSKGIIPSDITPLDRLAYMGNHALGALTFTPDHNLNHPHGDVHLDHIALDAEKIMTGASDEILARLISLNGSSAGARPKALIGVNHGRDHIIHGAHDLPDQYEPWIVKFSNSHDGADAGAIEYVYALMAKKAGVQMPDIHLFPSSSSPGFFAVKRFDRDGTRRFHMHSACGLLHSDFRTPSLDYEDLITLTAALTRDMREVEKVYRLAVFNILAHNRDDHSKNFSFLMDSQGIWRFAPAYDLTFSSGPGGEQSTTIMGEGRAPELGHLHKLAEEAKITKRAADDVIEATRTSLATWPELAGTFGVTPEHISIISQRIMA